MKIDGLNYEIFLNDIADHANHKQNLLELIDRMPDNSHDNVTKTDWEANYDKPYFNYFREYILQAPYSKLTKYLHADNYEIKNGWFQQYEKGDSHNWHTHASCNYTNVYFVELPDKDFGTELWDSYEKKVKKLDLKEGSLLTFPANVLHRSKTNTSKRKTIISFNSNFYFKDNLCIG